ncbi:hypothetical protein DDE18_19610 [Nocardioides gansuensis]|uniref:histidine kinase n=1 Tax=Nocardioides gansuensis TaxID=2138300 RepID=A0A2T8F5P2_9ACTN|nr:hypothetical protein DDE18_19610 [Nocardioides gansuensis]
MGAAHVAGLLAYALGAWAARDAMPPDEAVGDFIAVGLAAGLLIRSPRAAWPLLTSVLAVVTFLSCLSAGTDLHFAVTSTAGTMLGVLVVAHRLHVGGGPPPLLSPVDFRVLARTSVLGAGLGGLGAAAAAWSAGQPWPEQLATAAFHLISYLVLVPFFMRVRRGTTVAGQGERMLQVTLLVGSAAVAFTVHNEIGHLGMVAMFPALAWAALRFDVRETLGQVLVVAVTGDVLTMRGLGSFSAAVGEATGSSWTLVFLQAYLIACVLVAVPFALMVALQSHTAAGARAQAATLQSIVDGARGVAIMVTTPKGEITLFNHGAEAQLGYRSADVVGRQVTMFLRRHELVRLASRFGVAPTRGDVSRALSRTVAPTDVELIRKDGMPRVHQVTLAPVLHDGGEPSAYVVTAEDVTERVRTQRSLEQALRGQRLREIDQIKDDFVSSVSHELRTPITSIMGYLELLEDGGFGELTPEQLDALSRVSGNSRRLLHLVDDLLTLSSLGDPGQVLVRKQIDLRLTALTAFDVVAPTAQGQGVSFDIDVPEEPVMLMADADQLERVLVNLMGNAVKFTPADGKVVTRVGCGRDGVEVSVADNGLGIPCEEQPRLFSRFFRSSTAADAAIQGTGLGLSIAWQIVELHGGRIEVDSEPGRGSEFRVVLPRVAAIG